MNPVARLVGDQIRRKATWSSYLLLVQVGLFSSGFYTFKALPLVRNAIALAAPLMLGGISQALLRQRPILQLPISRAAFWRAEWWLTVLLPAAATACTIAISATLHGTLTIDSAGLPAIYCFVGIGLYKWLVTATSLGQRMDAPVAPGDLGRVLTIAIVGTPFLLGVPAAIAFVLPQHGADVNVYWSAALLCVMALGLSTYFHQPPLDARPSMRVSSPPVSTVAHVRDARSQASSGLTGWRMALWIEVRRRFLTFATLLGLVVAATVVAGLFRPLPPLSEMLSNMDMLPFASTRAHSTEAITWGALLAFSAMGDPIRTIDWRALRSQPIRSRDLALLPLIWGMLSAATLFAAMAIVHVLALAGMPVALRTDLFAAVAALVAFAEVTKLFVTSRMLSGMVLFVPISAVWLLLGSTETYPRNIVQPATLAISLLVLAATVPISRAVFTRSPRLYRARPMVVRIGA